MGDNYASYITDGLIFQLDGINRGTNDPKQWVDLIGGKIYTTNSGNDATWGTNHLICSCQMDCESPNLYPEISSGYTLEVVFECNNSNNQYVYQNKEYQQSTRQCFAPCLGKYGQNWLLSNWNNSTKGRTSIPFTSMGIGTNIISVTTYPTKGVYVNGASKTYGGVDFYYAVSNKSYLGSFTGKLYAIRMYNKVLTQAEILNNQRVDNKRFNLGLTL